MITTETPALFGLHPNAELDFRKMQSESLFGNLAELEPKDSKATEETNESAGSEDNYLNQCENINNKIAETFNIQSLLNAAGEDRDPFKNVFIQECEQMKTLMDLIKKNTTEIKDASEGKLTMSEAIEKLIDTIKLGKVPEKWIEEGFSSQRKLGSWIISLDLRIAQLKFFESEMAIPRIVFVNRLFNPLSYLTAIRQVFAKSNSMELDKVLILTEPTNIILDNNQDNIPAPKDSFYIYGFHLQGARWDDENKIIDESKPREDYCVMPVINCRVSESASGKYEESKTHYLCPVYKTTNRMMTYVTTAQFRTKANPNKWVIAGVAAILDVEKTDSVSKYLK
jgi:dynein heavy chain